MEREQAKRIVQRWNKGKTVGLFEYVEAQQVLDKAPIPPATKREAGILGD